MYSLPKKLFINYTHVDLSLIHPAPWFRFPPSIPSLSSFSLPSVHFILLFPSSLPLSLTQCSVPRSLWLGCSSVAESLCALRCLQSIPSTRAHNQVLPVSSYFCCSSPFFSHVPTSLTFLCSPHRPSHATVVQATSSHPTTLICPLNFVLLLSPLKANCSRGPPLIPDAKCFSSSKHIVTKFSVKLLQIQTCFFFSISDLPEWFWDMKYGVHSSALRDFASLYVWQNFTH